MSDEHTMDDFKAEQPGSQGEKFGTFLGVYTPSVLTMLGLIMYLRFGWVVGNLGLGLTVIVVLLASSITFITALSASAVATNMRVGVGGEYFMVSRSLGLAPGGAIGIPLFLCRTLSITFYSFGLAESIVSLWLPEPGPGADRLIQILAAIIILVITAVAGKRAMRQRWGDLRAGFWVALARFSLLQLRHQRQDPRNWRPHILLYLGDAAKRISLVRLASWFNQNRGVVTSCQLVVGDLERNNIPIERMRQEMDQTLEEEGLVSFCELFTFAPSARQTGRFAACRTLQKSDRPRNVAVIPRKRPVGAAALGSKLEERHRTSR